MKKQFFLLILLIGSLAYAVYSYWPLFSVYLPDLGRAGLQEAAPELVKVAKPVEKPAPKPAPPVKKKSIVKEEKAKKPEKAVVKKPPKKEAVALIDPFARRIYVKSRSAAAAEKDETKKEVKKDEPELEGIWVDSGMRIAFISGQALTEGNVVLGWRVSRITKSEVVLVKGRKRNILKLEAIFQ